MKVLGLNQRNIYHRTSTLWIFKAYLEEISPGHHADLAYLVLLIRLTRKREGAVLSANNAVAPHSGYLIVVSPVNL